MSDSEAQAMWLRDEFMAASNARDLKTYSATFNYPSVRIAGGRVVILDGPDSHRPDMFDWLAALGWHYSRWDHHKVIHASDEKIHFDTRFSRYRQDGSKIGSYDSLYVVTKQADHWGIQARSSFAP